jgi:formylglycine-generating enzyme required for sulfatase activity
VTNAQFAAFLNEMGNQIEGGVTWLDVENEDCLIEQSGGQFQPIGGFENHPVIEVSWYGAVAYCEQWAEARLPTEAEWEYAARGEESYVFPWGNESPGCDKANYGFCMEGTTAVGSYPDSASWVGALDMAGNVWEWTSSLYMDYPYRADDGREDPTISNIRVLRGGSTESSDWDLLRSAYRRRNASGTTDISIGFRCAKDSQ